MPSPTPNAYHYIYCFISVKTVEKIAWTFPIKPAMYPAIQMFLLTVDTHSALSARLQHINYLLRKKYSKFI